MRHGKRSPSSRPPEERSPVADDDVLEAGTSAVLTLNRPGQYHQITAFDFFSGDAE
jgi:hypothetical protein